MIALGAATTTATKNLWDDVSPFLTIGWQALLVAAGYFGKTLLGRRSDRRKAFLDDFAVLEKLPIGDTKTALQQRLDGQVRVFYGLDDEGGSLAPADLDFEMTSDRERGWRLQFLIVSAFMITVPELILHTGGETHTARASATIAMGLIAALVFASEVRSARARQGAIRRWHAKPAPPPVPIQRLEGESTHSQKR